MAPLFFLRGRLQREQGGDAEATMQGRTHAMMMAGVGCGLCQLCQVLKTRIKLEVKVGKRVVKAVKLSSYFCEGYKITAIFTKVADIYSSRRS